MKKFLSKTSTTIRKRLALSERSESKGFTLIELLIVVAIIAILTVIAISIYAGVQAKARDGRRQAEIDSLSKSLEVKKNASDQTYIYLTADYNADYPQTKPTDPKPNSTKYCVAVSTTTTPPTIPLIASWDPAVPDACPTTGTWAQIPYPTAADIFTDAANIAAWTLCARLEASAAVFCKTSLTN